MTAVAQSPDLTLWQEHFDFLLPRKPLLRADEVAKALGCDERTVHRLFDDGQLPGHELNAATGQRQMRLYRRDGVILLLAGKANYAPTDLRQRLMEVMANLPKSDKAALYHALGKMLLQ
jgi:excisionase family DNA binding protein